MQSDLAITSYRASIHRRQSEHAQALLRGTAQGFGLC
jgi:hypothetical protein